MRQRPGMISAVGRGPGRSSVSAGGAVSRGALLLLLLASCGDAEPSRGSDAASAAAPPASAAVSSPAPERPAASAIATPSATATGSAAPGASDGQPTDAELEQALRERTSVAKEGAVHSLCIYQNPEDLSDCHRLRPKGGKDVVALDRSFHAMLDRVTDPSRRKAWKKAWRRAADNGVVEVPPPTAAASSAASKL